LLRDPGPSGKILPLMAAGDEVFFSQWSLSALQQEPPCASFSNDYVCHAAATLSLIGGFSNSGKSSFFVCESPPGLNWQFSPRPVETQVSSTSPLLSIGCLPELRSILTFMNLTFFRPSSFALRDLRSTSPECHVPDAFVRHSPDPKFTMFTFLELAR